MKSVTQTKKQPRRESAKASRDATPVRRASQQTPPVQAAAAPPTAHANGDKTSRMPDLTAFGVDQRDAEAHVGHCEPCGREHQHVTKNPKDAMALQSFGRNIAVCLAAGDRWEGHGKKPGAIGPRGGEGKP